MGLKPRFIEYFNYNINTYSDLALFMEEIKKLLDQQLSLTAQLTAHGFSCSEFGNTDQDTVDLDAKPSAYFFNTAFSPLDYSSGNGVGANQRS